MRTFRWLASLAIIVLLSPIWSVFLVSGIAELAGCGPHYGGSSSCVLFGFLDLGPMLSFVTVFPWLGFYTVPAAMVVAIIWIIAEVVARRRSR